MDERKKLKNCWRTYAGRQVGMHTHNEINNRKTHDLKLIVRLWISNVELNEPPQPNDNEFQLHTFTSFISSTITTNEKKNWSSVWEVQIETAMWNILGMLTPRTLFTHKLIVAHSIFKKKRKKTCDKRFYLLCCWLVFFFLSLSATNSRILIMFVLTTFAMITIALR